MGRLRSLALISVAAAVPFAAWANGTSLPDTLNVAIRPGNTTEVGLEANFGWLSSPDGGDFTWVCHETVLAPTSELTPFFFLGQNVTLVTVRALGVSVDPAFSVFRSVDGCTWTSVADLENVNVRELAFDPGTPDHVLAASFTGSGATNGIWESDDSGATWHKTSLDLADRYFRSVEFSQANPLRVWATATWFQPSPSAWVYRSDDGGDTWSVEPWTFSIATTLQGNVDVVLTSTTNQDVAWARTNGGTDYLLITTNGGAAWEPVFSVADDIRGIVIEPGTGAVRLATPFQGTWRAEDGRNFVQVTADVTATRGLAADSRGIFAVGNNYEDGFALGLTTNGGTSYQNLFRFIELDGPRVCPAGSTVQEKCDPLWPAIAQLLGISTPTPTPTPPSGDDDDDGGGTCRCSFESGPATIAPVCAAMLILAMGVLRARRRSSR